MRMLSVFLFTLLLTLPVTASQIQELTWGDLVPVLKIENPFEALTEEQLGSLGFVARIRQDLADGQKLRKETLKEAAELEAELAAACIDIDGLLAQREEIRLLREKRGTAAVDRLDGAIIRIPGFVLPLKHSGRKVTEFLLVPSVGACIHEPLPEPNQIVHVVLDGKNAFESKGKLEQIWVEGQMKNQSSLVDLYLNDDAREVNVTYQLSASLVEKYEQ